MVKVAVVILNWNGIAYLKHFLPSVVKYSNESARIIVADNGSVDGSIDFLQKYFPSVEVLQLDQNYGFAGGYNRALANIQAEYYILLNSDVEVTDNWIDPVVKEMDADKHIAAAMPKIKAYANKKYFEYAGAAGGFMDSYGYVFCRGRLFNDIEEDHGQYDDPVDVFWATGACLFIRSEIFHRLGGFDDSFFAHMEEIDLCWRIKNDGFRIMCYPRVEVFHAGGGTLPYNNPRKVFLNFRNNWLTLYKNLPRKRLNKILFFRFLLDLLAAFQFLIYFKPSSSWAIIRAHVAFFKLKHRYRELREQLKGHNKPV
ncbi:MAG: glycosyltransferase family 2 protein, partial [Bacteroidota bacterium]